MYMSIKPFFRVSDKNIRTTGIHLQKIWCLGKKIHRMIDKLLRTTGNHIQKIWSQGKKKTYDCDKLCGRGRGKGTIDHKILLRRIESHCGISGTVSALFRSYLSVRTQSVVMNGIRSTAVPLKHGVP